MDATKRAEWERKYRDALQPLVDEPVLAGGLFYRTGGWSEIAMGPFSGLAAVISRSIGKHRAGGLPNQFLLAVTPTRLHAFKCSTAYGNVEAKDELIVWERAGLMVTAEETSVNTKVVIEMLAGGRAGRLLDRQGRALAVRGPGDAAAERSIGVNGRMHPWQRPILPQFAVYAFVLLAYVGFTLALLYILFDSRA